MVVRSGFELRSIGKGLLIGEVYPVGTEAWGAVVIDDRGDLHGLAQDYSTAETARQAVGAWHAEHDLR